MAANKILLPKTRNPLRKLIFWFIGLQSLLILTVGGIGVVLFLQLEEAQEINDLTRYYNSGPGVDSDRINLQDIRYSNQALSEQLEDIAGILETNTSHLQQAVVQLISNGSELQLVCDQLMEANRILNSLDGAPRYNFVLC